MNNPLLPAHLIAALGAFIFVFALAGLAVGIFYILTLQRALNRCSPASRTMSPGLTWLLLIPLFGLIWQFFIVLAISKSVRNEFNARGVLNEEPEPGKAIGLAMAICTCASIVPLIGVVASLAGLVLWIVYWVKVADLAKKLETPVVATI